MISIVIPAFNEEKNIGKCLEALGKLRTRHDLEVIVVDNASTDRTAAVAEAYRVILPGLRVLHEPMKGRGAARKRGFAAAKGDPIFSLDADTVVPSNWVNAYLEVFANDPKTVAVTGIPRICDCNRLDNTIFNTLMPLQMKAYRVLFGHYWLSGFSFAIRRDAYEKAGGFDAVADCGEDLDLAFRVYKSKSGKIRLEELHPVEFSGRRFKKGLLRGYMEYAAAFIVKFVLRQQRVVLQVVDNDGKPVDDSGAPAPVLKEVMVQSLKRVTSKAAKTVREVPIVRRIRRKRQRSAAVKR